MKILKIVGIIVISLLAIVFILLFYMGMFSKLEVKEKEMGPYTMAFERFVGPYSQTKVAFDNVYNKLKERNFVTSLGIGIYYDNPAEVPANELKSDCGSIIEEKDLNRLAELQGFVEVKTIASGKSLVTSMPIKNTMSYMIGPMKAYPTLMKYATANNIELGAIAFEIYDMKNKIIYYVFQVKS